MNSWSTTKHLTENKTLSTFGKPEKGIIDFTVIKPNHKSFGLRSRGQFKVLDESKPLVSIVTVVLDGERHIEQTILSVLQQTYDHIEYIIIDGGSSDRTVEIIKKYDSAIDYWISESDGGISDAFNKGIIQATGEIIGIVNADDYYELDAIETIVKNSGNADIIYGAVRYWFTDTTWKIKQSYPKGLLRLGMCITHPTCFVKKSVYENVGLFSLDYSITMDYHFLSRCYKKGYKFKDLKPSIISNFRYGGTSKTNIRKTFLEEKKVQQEIFKIPKLISNIIYYLKLLAIKLDFLKISPHISKLFK